MDHNQIKKVVNSLSKLIDDSEKVALPLFASKLARASQAYPEDHTIGMMANITARMAGSKLFITRAEVKDLYNKLFSRNTKFAELFQDELGVTEKPEAPKVYNREHDDESLSLLNKAYDKVVDPTLANALNAAFGNNKNTFNDTNATNAKEVCSRQCSSVKVASSVDVVSGNENFIICRALFETPKGQTSIFVPVEIYAGKALIPSVFVGNNGPEELSKDNIEKYVFANAGRKLNISDKVILEALKDEDITKISNVDLALIKLNSQKETQSDYFSNSVLFQKTDKEIKNANVSTPSYKDQEIESFAKSFDSPVGIAGFNLGKDKVKLARDLISNKLNSFGLDNHQIAVYASDEKSVTYAVSLNAGKTAFRVPVKIENGRVLDPTILISNGSIESFSKSSFSSILNKEAVDYKIAAVASPLYGLKASELVQLVREAMAEQNYAKAEDALNILSQNGDDKAYQTAFASYTNGLGTIKTASENTPKCTMIVKNAHSKHELCGHTGLPLHKVYQDKNGDCHPSYRKGMDDTQEGAYFLNSKIFF
jgi:hypothetical protein